MRRILPRVILAVAIVGLVAMWVYAFSPLSDREEADQLDDRDYAARAEAICAPTAKAVEAIRESSQSRELDDRADKVEDANEELGAMLRELRTIEPESEADQRIVDQWLADWDTLIADRERWIDKARTEGDEQLYVTDRGGMSITETMDAMVKANDMESCATPIGI